MNAEAAYLSSGAAALHALPPQEAQDFNELAESDDAAAAELLGFRETAARLGSVVAEAPPAALRDRVLAQIAITRQLPPLVEGARAGRHAESELPAADLKAEAGPQVSSLAEHRARRGRLGTKWLLAAAAVVILGVGTFVVVNNDDPAADPNVAIAQCVANATDKATRTPTADSQGNSQVVLSASCNAATFSVSQLAPLEQQRVYQLWVMAGEDARSVGLLTPDANGIYPAVTAPLHVGDTDMGISVEPAGGSKAPTTAPIVVVPIKA